MCQQCSSYRPPARDYFYIWAAQIFAGIRLFPRSNPRSWEAPGWAAKPRRDDPRPRTTGHVGASPQGPSAALSRGWGPAPCSRLPPETPRGGETRSRTLRGAAAAPRWRRAAGAAPAGGAAHPRAAPGGRGLRAAGGTSGRAARGRQAAAAGSRGERCPAGGPTDGHGGAAATSPRRSRGAAVPKRCGERTKERSEGLLQTQHRAPGRQAAVPQLFPWTPPRRTERAQT